MFVGLKIRKRNLRTEVIKLGVVKRSSDVGRVRSVVVIARECVVVARDRVVMVRNRVVRVTQKIPKEIEDVGSEVDVLLFPWKPVSDEEPFK
ncbi:hypothetical protein F2Q70_00039762 [Brassica cretica]|uniref:Uncharacterized protein n=1 Tax=Brassica cretica TaxID=69181 RepID=A0A8S9K554_BRACR|nr:hypothetical protein F2Q70_00039762 [Brassica cretica]